MKIFKWICISFGVILTVLIVAATVLFLISKQHENEIYQIDVAAIDYTFENETEMLSWGEHVDP